MPGESCREQGSSRGTAGGRTGSCRGVQNTKVGAHSTACVCEGKRCQPPTHPPSAPRPRQGEPEPLTICFAVGVRVEGPWQWGEFLDPGKADHPSRSPRSPALLQPPCQRPRPCPGAPSVFASAALITLARRACLYQTPGRPELEAKAHPRGVPKLLRGLGRRMRPGEPPHFPEYMLIPLCLQPLPRP